MEFIQTSVYFGVVLTLAAYLFGVWLKKKWNVPIVQPLLIAIVVILAILLLGNIDYKVYAKGADYISYLLTPTTVALAVPLYEQLALLKKNMAAILAGILAGALTSAVCVLGIAILFSFDHSQYVTMLPKSVTAAIGMGISEELGGIVTITVAVIVITGVVGNILAETVCKVFRITEPVAKGIGIGSAAHALGTVKAMEMGPVEGAMSSLSIAVSGLITVVIAPIFAMFY